MARQRPTRGAPWLVMGPCIVEIDRIVIRDVHYQFEVNQCRNEEVMVKVNFWWVWSMWAGIPKVEIDRIVIREVQNEEVIVKGNFGWAWPMLGTPQGYKMQFWVGVVSLVMGPCIVEIDRIVIREVQYQFEVNRCRNEEINLT
ncbi:hypothetical protein DPMN_002591 [Dreissena polymorpha]|uniref:Uncharacterized protein n=1 Tax=Dreissena polymorpha TaxID=45954 RepID=A0A9D4MLM4_DREPO|nr:hypothetical protein DPMN_002591 [Dreissena polymorpha]